MDLACLNARSLIPAYLDGELSEGQAGPLRRHLFDCPECRESAKGGTVLKRWFSEGDWPAVEVPSGFAARVARRAFAGDPGLAASAPVAAEAAPILPFERKSQLPFLLKLTAAAAALLFVFALAIQNRSLPDGERLDASQRIAPWEREASTYVPAVAEEPVFSPETAADEDPRALPRESGR